SARCRGASARRRRGTAPRTTPRIFRATLSGLREERERPHLDALPHGGIRPRAGIVERAVRREAGAGGRGIEALEEQRLVGRHAREVEPGVRRAPPERVDLPGAIAIAEI